METLVFILQIVLTVALTVLMAVQTDKVEQGGVMGLGAAGGRSTSSIDLPVGAERILKPLTTWVAVGFLACSILSAIDGVTIWHFLVVLVIYLLLMLFGSRIWQVVTRTAR